MKPTTTKMKQELKIKQRLELVRARIRELTPDQLTQANGGGPEFASNVVSPTTCTPFYTL